MLFSLICTLLFWLIGPVRAAFLALQIASLAALSLLGWRQRKSLASPLRGVLALRPIPAKELLVWPPLVLVAGAAVWMAWRLFLLAPHGGWDAWAIWNLKARFLARAGVQAMSHPDLAWSHPDYPLLLPSLVASLWVLAGKESTVAPAMVACGLLIGLGLVTGCAVGLLRGRAHGLLAAALVWGTPSVITQGVSQYADLPLSFFITSALAVALAFQATERKLSLVGLAGLLAGGAAWTKNEGLVFLLVFVVVLFACHVRESLPAAFKISGCALLGAVLPLLFVIAHKVSAATPTDLWAQASLATLSARVGDISRLQIVLSAFWEHGFSFGGMVLPVIPLLLIYGGLSMYANLQSNNQPSFLCLPVFVLMLMSVGYALVYMLSPHDLQWHIATSLPRLWLHLYPGLVIVTLGAGGTRDAVAADT